MFTCPSLYPPPWVTCVSLSSRSVYFNGLVSILVCFFISPSCSARSCSVYPVNGIWYRVCVPDFFLLSIMSVFCVLVFVCWLVLLIKPVFLLSHVCIWVLLLNSHRTVLSYSLTPGRGLVKYQCLYRSVNEWKWSSWWHSCVLTTTHYSRPLREIVSFGLTLLNTQRCSLTGFLLYLSAVWCWADGVQKDLRVVCWSKISTRSSGSGGFLCKVEHCTISNLNWTLANALNLLTLPCTTRIWLQFGSWPFPLHLSINILTGILSEVILCISQIQSIQFTKIY